MDCAHSLRLIYESCRKRTRRRACFLTRLSLGQALLLAVKFRVRFRVRFRFKFRVMFRVRVRFGVMFRVLRAVQKLKQARLLVLLQQD